jgi:site-specific DNA recombinase
MAKQPTTKRAAIYCRLSRKRGDERSASTERQEADCRKLAKAQGLTVAMVEVDDDRSAYSGKPRPGYEAVTEAVRSGAVDVVLAWAPDRLHRSPRELEDFVDLIESTGTEVVTVQGGRVDFTTPAGRMQARMLGNVARYESEHRSARTKRAHQQIAEEGRWAGGVRPFGYRPEAGGTLRVDPTEAAVIREAVARIIAGELVGSVANDFTRRGIPTVKGAQWRTATLRRIITSPTIAGRRVVGGEDAGPAQWPAIATAEEVAKVVAVLARGSHRGRVARVALLAGGRLTCERCAEPMHTAQRENGRRIYRCLTCFAQVAAEPLEELVSRVLVARLDSADLPAPAGGASSPVADDLAQLEDDLAALAADHGAGVVSRAEWMAARAPLLARRDAAQAVLTAAAGTAALDGLMGKGRASEVWPTLTLDRRQAVLDAMVSGVVVKRATRRGPGLDPNRVDIAWRA